MGVEFFANVDRKSFMDIAMPIQEEQAKIPEPLQVQLELTRKVTAYDTMRFATLAEPVLSRNGRSSNGAAFDPLEFADRPLRLAACRLPDKATRRRHFRLLRHP